MNRSTVGAEAQEKRERKKRASNMLARLKRLDLEKILAKVPLVSEADQRQLFVAGFLLNIVAYFMFISHHMLHNHMPRFPWINLNDQLHAGRWFNYFLIQIYYTADLPVFLPLFGISIGVATALILARLWRLNLSKLETFVVVGVITTFPITLSYFYYSFQTPLYFISVFFSVAAVAVCRSPKPLSLVASAVLVMLSLASYQPALSVAAATIVSCFIADMIHSADEESPTPIASALLLAAARALAVGLGGVLYMFSLWVGGFSASDTTVTVGLREMPERAVYVVRTSFEHLWITQPDLLTPVKLAMIVILVLAVASTAFHLRKDPLRASLTIMAFPALIIASKAMFLVSPDAGVYVYRYNPGLPIVHGFSVAVLLATLNIKTARSVALLLSFFVLVQFVQADLLRQNVLHRGEQHDLALANRILSRIEALPGLDFTKTYDLVRIGEYSNFRRAALRLSRMPYDKPGDFHMDYGEITAPWADEEVFVLLGSKVKFRHRGYDKAFEQKIATARREHLAGKKPWPYESSVFLKDQTIYVYMK